MYSVWSKLTFDDRPEEILKIELNKWGYNYGGRMHDYSSLDDLLTQSLFNNFYSISNSIEYAYIT